MFVKNYKEVRQDDVAADGARGVKVRWLINQDDGAPNFALREFEVAPGGHTPYHAHPWEHEVYVLEGEGFAAGEEGEFPLAPGTVVFVPPNAKHNFKNAGAGPLRFLCVVPRGAT